MASVVVVETGGNKLVYWGSYIETAVKVYTQLVAWGFPAKLYTLTRIPNGMKYWQVRRG